MPPSTSLAVVLEVRETGDRLVWDFNQQQERVITTSVGGVAEWIRIDAEDVHVMQALVPTSDVDIRQIPGRHVKLKVPGIKLPDTEKDLGIGLGVDRAKRFFCPLLGPVDHFSNTSHFPENVFVELDVVKVPKQLKAAVKAKAGYEPEWMFVGQSLKELTRDEEEEFASLLEQLKRARMRGVVVRSAGSSHVVVSEGDNGQRQLFMAQDADVHVGQLISFLPVRAPFTAPVQFAASCLILTKDFLLTVDEETHQFRVSSAAAVEFTNERYRLARLGWIEDPNGCIASADGRAENVIFAMDLDLSSAHVTFAACGIVPGASEKVRIIRQQSLESSEDSFTDELSSDKGNVKFQSSNGSGKSASGQHANAPWLNKPKILESKEYTLVAVCSSRKGDEIIFVCDAEGFDRSKFTCKIQTFKAVAHAKEPILGQWYELKLRFFAKKSLDLPRTDISYLRPIDRPEAPYASSRAVRQESPTSSKYATAASNFSRPSSSMSTAPKQLASAAQKEKEEGSIEYTLSACLTHIKGFEAFFICPAADFTPMKFIAKTKPWPVASAPVAGQWYELTLTFSAKCLSEQSLPHAFVKLAKSIRKPSTPYFSYRARLPNGSQSDSQGTSEASRKTTTTPGPQPADENAPEYKEEELVAFIIAEVGDKYKLYAPKKCQSPSNPFFFTKKFCFDGLSPVLGAWYKLNVKWTNPGYVFVLDVRQVSPLMPTRVQHGVVVIHSRLIPAKPLGRLPCAESQELGFVADVDRVAASAFRGGNSSRIDCWCAPRDRTEFFSFKAAWKVVSLVGSDNLSNGMSKLSVQDDSTSSPSSSAQKDAIDKKRCTGVVCYKEGELCYVYSPQLGREALLPHPPSNIQAGTGLNSTRNIFGDNKECVAVGTKQIDPLFPSSPIFRSVVVECDVMVPMRVDETDPTVTSNFIGGIRDVYGLVSDATPGVHKATIRYIYEEGSPSGYWQLEYIRVKKAP
ncbi:hypothetical protein AAVH_08914 [Aphelenchoides avenae]|nr:hypothetical protein AAVH_08914 [Aphelenchus avenae]